MLNAKSMQIAYDKGYYSYAPSLVTGTTPTNPYKPSCSGNLFNRRACWADGYGDAKRGVPRHLFDKQEEDALEQREHW